MKYDEYEAQVNEALLSFDKAPAIFKDLLGSLKSDLTAFDSLKASSAEQEKRIKDLQETNVKLYMLAGDGKKEAPDKEPETEKTPDDYKAEFIKKLSYVEQNGGNNGDK